MKKRDNIKKNKENTRIIRRERFMCKACEIAKFTINECIDRGFKIDTPKVQKLLVIMQGRFLANYGEPLFPESVEVWECGVAIREVNKAFKSFAFGIEEKQDCFLILLDREEAIVHSVIREFGRLDVFEINQNNVLKSIKTNLYKGSNLVVSNDYLRKVFGNNECTN